MVINMVININGWSYMVDGHPIHNKDPKIMFINKSLWTIGWLAPMNGY